MLVTPKKALKNWLGGFELLTFSKATTRKYGVVAIMKTGACKYVSLNPGICLAICHCICEFYDGFKLFACNHSKFISLTSSLLCFIVHWRDFTAKRFVIIAQFSKK